MGRGFVSEPVVEPNFENLTSEHTTDELVAFKLADAGLSPEIISYAVGLPITTVRTLIIKRRPAPVPLIDESLAEGVRNLAAAALREAHVILEFGPAHQKLTIIKSMLGGLSRHVANTNTAEAAEQRGEFEELMIEMRRGGIPEREKVVTETGILDVESSDATASPFAESPDDQD